MNETLTSKPETTGYEFALLFEHYYYQLSNLNFQNNFDKAAKLFAILTAIEAKQLRTRMAAKAYEECEACAVSSESFKTYIKNHPHKVRNLFEGFRKLNAQLNPNGRK